ncbi:hypothetical protein CPB85DRAFT_1338919, partial [Mucidula mucida]
GEQPPEQSEWQRLVEDPAFGTLEVAKTHAGVDDDAAADAGAISVSTTGAESSRGLRTACIICGDRIHIRVSIRAPCQHYYCYDCVRDLIRSCTSDESLYPPRCCNQPLVDTVFLPVLPLHIRTAFQVKSREFGTLAMHRIYCPSPTCSAFLGSSESIQGDIHCSVCPTSVCSQCKQRAHPGERCPEDTATLAVRAFAAEQRWQTCPGCRGVIELHTGCYHMTCRCRTEFCYVCAEPWKNCTCPQWDEDRLVEVVQRRVEEEMGPRAAVAQPVAFQRTVQQRVAQLRDNHDCDVHWWRRRYGGAQCEECYHFLPEYILVCRNCQLQACVRCSRNRL